MALRPTSRGKSIGHDPRLAGALDILDRVAPTTCTALLAMQVEGGNKNQAARTREPRERLVDDGSPGVHAVGSRRALPAAHSAASGLVRIVGSARSAARSIGSARAPRIAARIEPGVAVGV